MELSKSKERIQGHKSALIIDDDWMSLHVAQSILENEGFLVQRSLSGLEAQERLFFTDFDLIIIDWTMPHLNGGETLRAMDSILPHQENPIPFILFTSQPPELIQVPHTQNFYLADFWSKLESIEHWSQRAFPTARRVKRRRK